jgi:hypothetical protein
MGIAIVSDPQSRANLLRESLRLDPSVRRMGARLRRVQGTEDRLLVQLRHGGRELRFERGPEWAGVPLDRTKAWLKEELRKESAT